MSNKRKLIIILIVVLVIVLALLALLGHSYYFGEYNYMYTPKFDLADYKEYIESTQEFEFGPQSHVLADLNLESVPNSKTAVKKVKNLWRELTGLDFADAQVSVSYCSEEQCWLVEEIMPRWPISQAQDWVGVCFGAIVDKTGNVIAVWYD